MKYLSFLFCTGFFLLVSVASAQYYSTGQDPASLKWMQIKTDRFTVIYPEKYGSNGVSFVKSLDAAYSKLITLYPEKKFRIPVIIHNYTTQSNGYVAWAPRRMEIYPTPEQNTIPLDPNEQLTIHEITHVLQMESLNKGFTKLFSVFLGEQFPGIVSSLLPLWFLEGDAVFSESVLTESGRGRRPSFQKQLKAISIEKGEMYKYDKMINGSFRDFVPDHYQSGYQMLAWSKVKYDAQLWNKVLDFTADQPFTLNPVNISLSKGADLTKKALFKETFDNLKTIWTLDYEKSKAVTYEIINPPKGRKFISYYSPVIAGKDSIIAIRTSLSDAPAFVMINPSEKSEKRINIPGRMYPWYISFAQGKLAWIEDRKDPRWENRNWSVIMIMDIRNNRKMQLTRNSRFMSASISPDGNYIVATENTIENKNNLVIIDAWNGQILKSVPVPGNAYLQRPQWDETGKQLTVIFLTERGEGIMSYNTTANTWNTLLKEGRNDLQSSFLRNDSLFFVSSCSGTDNVYLLSPDKSIKGLTRSGFGIIDLHIDKNIILFSDYSSSGNNICFTTLSEAFNSGEINNTESSFLINQVNTTIRSTENIKTPDYTPVPYRKWLHLFRFHSWMPFYADIEEIKSDPSSIRPGFTLMSQNQLSTLTSSFGYEYSYNKRHTVHSRITWEGLYPVVESQLDYGEWPIINKLGESVGNPQNIRPDLLFTNTISIPMTFSSGKFFHYLRPSVSAAYHNRYVYMKDKGIYDIGQTQVFARLYFSNYRISAYRDIYPKWAQVFDLNYSYSPSDKDIYGPMTTIKTAFYFPGFFTSNGIKIRLEKELQTPAKFILQNRIPFPRGYKNISSENLAFLSVDYVMPLAYPDFNIASFFYLTRIRSGFFYDFARGIGNYYYSDTNSGLTVDEFRDYSETFKSFGIELLSDFYLFRLPFMVSGGVQASWRSFTGYPVFEFLFTIDLFGMSIGRNRF